MATAIRTDETLRLPTTAEELLLMPEGTHGEIVRGVYVPMTGGSPTHGSVIARITVALGNVVYARNLGEVFGAETTFRLARNPETSRCPDASSARTDRLSLGATGRVFEGPPDLAVEVLSPSNTGAEMERKTADYLRSGARQVWMVDPETRSVVVHTAGGLPRFLDSDGVLDGGDLLPGFTTPVKTFFAGLPAADA